MDEIMTVEEVANLLRISRTTVWRWVKENKIVGFKIGRNWRFRRSDVEAAIERSKVQPSQDEKN